MHLKFQAKETALIFVTPVSSQQNDKRPNEDERRLPQTLGCGLGRFVRQYTIIGNIHIAIWMWE